MTLLLRSLLAMLLTRWLWSVLLLYAFVLIAAVSVVLTTQPFVPMLRLLHGLLDVALLVSPVLLPAALCWAQITGLWQLERQQTLLWCALCGRDPRRVLLPLLLPAAAVSGLLWWWQTTAIPAAHYQSRFVLGSLRENPTTLLVRTAARPTLAGQYRATWEDLDGEALLGVALTAHSPDGDQTLLWGRRATLALTPDGVDLMVTLEHGRLLRLRGTGELDQNLRFDSLRLGLDAGALSAPSKRSLLDLKYYTNAELDQIADQRRVLFEAGHELEAAAQRRVNAVALVRALRFTGALLPVCFVLLAIRHLGVRLGPTRLRRSVLVAVACAWLLMQQEVLEVHARKLGTLVAPGWALTPLVTTALLLLPWPGRRRPEAPR